MISTRPRFWLPVVLSLLLMGLPACNRQDTAAPSVNGEILSDQGGVTLLKVWGTHHQRGFAQGFLMADGIADLHGRYIVSHFRERYAMARDILQDASSFLIPDAYVEEARGGAEGLAAAGIEGLDAWDWLLMNAFLDVTPLLPDLPDLSLSGPGCSTLLSWGEGAGGPVATRHLDWGAYPGLIGNNLVVVHLPAEPDEQPWAMVGFNGMSGALSGMNRSGLAGFMHVTTDRTHGEGDTGRGYIPIWYALRQGLEKKDFNGDGRCDTQDFRQALLSGEQGFADGFIAALMGPDNGAPPAVVAEIAPQEPHHVFRTESFEDQIPGRNLYAANREIARLGQRNYCGRYAAVAAELGREADPDAARCWTLMRDHSNSGARGWDNLQFMQYDASVGVLKLSVYDSELGQAWQRPPLEYDLQGIWATTP
jgi:hypothetical protein